MNAEGGRPAPPYRKVKTGDHLDEFILLEKLGEGGYGEVWKAERFDAPGRYVALKIPSRPEALEPLREEARALRDLDHPNIVKVLSFDDRGDPPYSVREYVDGRNLRRLMVEDGILPPVHATGIAIEIGEALAATHARGLVHKDVKPENILVESRPAGDAPVKGKAVRYTAKLADLGLALPPLPEPERKAAADSARTTGVRLMSGSLFYMAPEQMIPSRPVDARADVYSLGVVLYEMLTGELPLGMDLPSELNPVVSPELDAVAKRALSIDRDNRYPTAHEMVADLRKARDPSLPKRAAPGPVPAVTPPRPAFRRVFTGGLLAALVIVATILASRSGPPAPSLPAATCGPIEIDSRPEGAEVRLDGTRAGTTPLQLPSVTFARHTFSLALEFHEPRTFVLEPRVIEGRMYFRILEEPGLGEIAMPECGSGCRLQGIDLRRQKGGARIATPRVDKASVYIDGQFYGVTPAELDSIQAGLRQFTIRKEGYKDFSFHEKIEAGAVVTKEIALLEDGTEPPNRPAGAQITIVTTPPEAAVYVGDEARGTTPLALELKTGSYELRLVKKYYEPRAVGLDVGDTDATRDYRLEKVAASVTFTSEPPGAAVSLEGVPVGVTPCTADRVEGGPHRAVFSKEGHYDQTAAFEVVDRQPVGPVKASLQKVPPGRLSLEAEIRTAEVFIDGKSVGRPPLAGLTVESGRRRLRFMDSLRDLSIEPGIETRLSFSLKDLGMASVPAGEFVYGAPSPKPGELHLHAEKTDAYGVDLCEVTNEQYAAFFAWISETGNHSRCHPQEGKRNHRPAFWSDPASHQPRHPVVGVTWFDAYAYAAWAGKRLPTEREWEKAARGKSGWPYPWGPDWNERETRCNWGDGGAVDGFAGIAPVGACPGASPYGCLDMVGNVSEWCADDYDGKSPNKVIRGGSFKDKEWATTTMRYYESPSQASGTIGFRCVATP